MILHMGILLATELSKVCENKIHGELLLLIFFIHLFYFMCTCVPECMNIHRMCAVPEEPRRGVRSPEAGITGGCEPPNMDAENRTPVFGKSSQHSYPQSHFSSFTSAISKKFSLLCISLSGNSNYKKEKFG